MLEEHIDPKSGPKPKRYERRLAHQILKLVNKAADAAQATEDTITEMFRQQLEQLTAPADLDSNP